MAEKYEAFKRFEYRENSSLVLQREGPSPATNEPTGEPESLKGKIKYKMGDKAIAEGIKKRKVTEDKASAAKDSVKGKKRSRIDTKKGASVLDSDVTENAVYKPTTRLNRIVYENIEGILQSFLGDYPQDVLLEATQEILEALKLSSLSDKERRAKVEEVTGKLSEDSYGKLFRLAKDIDDFQSAGVVHRPAESAPTGGGLDDATGVAVIFDEEDEEDAEEDAEDYEAVEAGEEEEEEEKERLGEEKEERSLAARMMVDSEDEEEGVTAEEKRYRLDVSKLDAHWLQRELRKVIPESTTVVATEREILSVLPTPDIQECENRLVMILKYENFEMAKLLLKNRWRVYFCTRLGQAQSEKEKEAVQNEMKQTPEGAQVLEELESMYMRKNKERELTRTVRQEAATLVERQQAAASKKAGTTDDMEDAVMQARKEDVEESRFKPSTFLDLDDISFDPAVPLMTNSRVKLPDGSQRIERRTHDEIIIQPLKHAPAKNEDMIEVSSLPAWAQPAFTSAGVSRLNPVQSRVFPCAFEDGGRNMLVCAPTGAGKTNIALLAMLNLIGRHRMPNGKIDLNSFKVVYLSPMKALVAEQVAAFSKRLEPFGINVRELTGDVSLSRHEIDETQVIVATPEKWDVVTRKASDRMISELVRLVIFDEIHLLHDARGPVLEALVARIIRSVETSQQLVRLVGLSATLPNYEDVAVFMRVSLEENKGLFVFGNHYRPVPLLQTYIGIKDKKATKRVAAQNQVCYEKVVENAGQNQILIFVHSRKDTVKTARAIRDLAMENDTLPRFLAEDSASREVLHHEAEVAGAPDLKDLLPYGFAVHHAGLTREDRKLVEDLFADRHIPVLVSTATLAWGINLPAHTVIIKGTQVYLPERGKWCELSPMDVMQMMGRAGRPQYDATGHGIIITNQSEIQFYLSLNNQQLPIESQMIAQLPDLMNAEIVAGTIRSRGDAVQWLGYTYLFVRMLRNPQLYGCDPDVLKGDPLLEQRRVDLAHSTLLILDKFNLIKYDKRSGNVQVTALGRVASHYYIKHPSIATYNEQLKPTMGDVELLRLFSMSNEFKFMPVRDEEKVELVKLLERVPVPVKGGIEETTTKVNVLLQAYISRLSLAGFALNSDMVFVQQSAGRIMRALFEICVKRGWASLAMRALKYSKMIQHRVWSAMNPLKQFNVLADEILRKLEKRDFAWERYYDFTPTELGELVRMPKLGKTLHKLVHHFPRLELQTGIQPITRTCIAMELTVTCDFQWNRKMHGTCEPWWVLVEDVDCEHILHSEYLAITEEMSQSDIVLNFVVPIQNDPVAPNIFVRVVSDRWLNAETLLPVSLKNLVLPEKNPPHTELLDLQPLPVAALRFPEAEALFSTTMKVFNPIQTQVFSAVYQSDVNLLICSPPASGKVVCAEFGILRMLQSVATELRKVVCVIPSQRRAQQRFLRWKLRFEKGMNLRVMELTGDLTTDLRVMTEANIVVTTPDKWDFLSRRWKTRKVLQRISLFIAEDIHCLDDPDVGAALEVCVSRIRYISAQLASPIRVMGFATSLMNAKDIAEWIGAPADGFFNFAPNVRPVPLEISIQGFDIHHRPTRLLAMLKPTYQCMKNVSPTKPVLVFVPDRKQARLCAASLLLQAAADNKPKRFLRLSDAMIQEQIASANFHEKSLEEVLKGGVGYLHEGFTDEEVMVVERLFQSGSIQVLVVTEPLISGLDLAAKLVIIQDTQRFDGSEGRWKEYPISEVLLMISKASRPNVDQDGGHTSLLCHGAHKEFYKRFIFEPIPIESALDHSIADHLNAEIVLKTVENKQDAVDWLTWTFYYRRLSKNPNYYSLSSVSHELLSDHLSELVETTCTALQQAQCVDLENDYDLSPLNLGLIAAFYYIRTVSIEMFNRSVTANTKKKAALEILTAAAEFERLPFRTGEEDVLKVTAASLGVRTSGRATLVDAHFKALVLIYAHFNRSPLTSDLQSDQRDVLETSMRLLQGFVDVIASNGWLRPALVTMELAQMLVQALGTTKKPLLQLPHFDETRIELAEKMNCRDVLDVIQMEDANRSKLLEGLTEAQVADVAAACNSYPIISVEYVMEGAEKVEMMKSEMTDDDEAVGHFVGEPGRTVRMVVTLERDMGDDETPGPVYARFYPKEKEEQWWLVIGRPNTNGLAAIKRLVVNKASQTAKLEMELPNEKGEVDYVLYLMSDCYAGCDQEYKFRIKLA